MENKQKKLKKMQSELEKKQRKQLKIQLVISPSKVYSYLYFKINTVISQHLDLEISQECIIITTIAIESIFKAIIEEAVENLKNLPEVVLGKDNIITLGMAQGPLIVYIILYLYRSQTFQLLYKNPFIKKVSRDFFDINCKRYLEKFSNKDILVYY